MDLKALRYFITVAEELNITRAAEKLHMSQPPLSAQIKALEEELDAELFIRGRRRLEMTEPGQMLYRRAKEILSLTEKTKSEIHSMGEGMRGTITSRDSPPLISSEMWRIAIESISSSLSSTPVVMRMVCTATIEPWRMQMWLQ
jgi:DNA-binding transcriptional LysR family regulator